MVVYRYYTKNRPPAPGAVPMLDTLLDVNPWPCKRREGDFSAWGYVEYSEPLTEAQIDQYELTDGIEL